MRFAIMSLRAAVAMALGMSVAATAADMTIAPTTGSGFVVQASSPSLALALAR